MDVQSAIEILIPRARSYTELNSTMMSGYF